MKTRMTPLSTAMLAASLMLSASAYAAPPGAPAGPKPEMRGEHSADHDPDRMAERHGERMEKQMAELKASLKLTAAQTPAWNTFHAAMKPPVRDQRMNRDDARREEWASLTTPQRLDRMRALRQEREAAATRREDATRAFYATLTADQQKTFDAHMAPPFLGEAPGGRGPR